MNWLGLLARNLRMTLVAVVICLGTGLAGSLPINFVVDAEATRFLYNGGVISGPERIVAHRRRVEMCAWLGVVIGLVAGQSAFWATEWERRRNETGGPTGSTPGPLAGRSARDDEQARANVREDDETDNSETDSESEPVECMACGAMIPTDSVTCLKCGWTYDRT